MPTESAHRRHDSLREAVDQLTRAGYRDEFTCDGATLLSRDTGRHLRPADMEIDREERYEGPTDPSEQQIVFALRHRTDGLRGTLVLPFGPAADRDQSKVLLELARPDAPSP